jgi:hypothetical protein
MELDHVSAESLKQLSLMGERALVNGSASPILIGHLDNNDFYSRFSNLSVEANLH